MKVVESDWGVEALEKSYQQGYMRGMIGDNRNVNPYKAEVIADAWEAGWLDGHEKYSAKQAKIKNEGIESA